MNYLAVTYVMSGSTHWWDDDPAVAAQNCVTAAKNDWGKMIQIEPDAELKVYVFDTELIPDAAQVQWQGTTLYWQKDEASGSIDAFDTYKLK